MSDLSFLKDFKTKFVTVNEELDSKEFALDPRQYNLPEDFIFIEHEWGSMFYKHIGNLTRIEAKQKCSTFGDSVHLPIPRFFEENEFYKVYFGNEGLWLGMSDSEEDGVFKSDDGYILHRLLKNIAREIRISQFEWKNISINLSSNPNLNGIKMTKTGNWVIEDEDTVRHNSVCIYNIIPDDCSKCAIKEFCRYKDASVIENECICPVMTRGKFCEKHLCEHCLNGGQCINNKKTDKNDCVCPYPYHGKHCELSTYSLYSI